MTTVAGVPALVAGRRGRTVVFFNAATEKGLELPALRRFLALLGGAGFRAVAPDLPGVREACLTAATVEAAVAVTRAVASDGQATLLGVSTGGGIALLVAADPRTAGLVSRVTAVAPFADLESARRRVEAGAAPPLLAAAVGRALAAGVDPAELSPLRSAHRIRARVEIVTAPDDPYFPLDETRALAEAAGARLTVTRGLDHVTPAGRGGIRGVLELAAVLARTLAPVRETVLLREATA